MTRTEDLVISGFPLLFRTAVDVPHQVNSRVAPWRPPSVTCQVPMSSCGTVGARSSGATYLKPTKLAAVEPSKHSSNTSHARPVHQPGCPAESVAAACCPPAWSRVVRPFLPRRHARYIL